MSRKKVDQEKGIFPVSPGKMLAPDVWKGRGRYSKTAIKQKASDTDIATPTIEDSPNNGHNTKRHRLEKWIKDQDQTGEWHGGKSC